MTTYCIEVQTDARHRPTPEEREVCELLRAAGLDDLKDVRIVRRILLDGTLTAADLAGRAERLLTDPLAERAACFIAEGVGALDLDRQHLEIQVKPGVMDPVAASIHAELRAEGLDVDAVRTARRYELATGAPMDELLDLARRRLANDCIEELVRGTSGVRPAPTPPQARFELRRVALRELDDDGLTRLSREGSLFLSLVEMRAIQNHYRGLERDPTDLELETLAQTWSEHCVHKTLKSAVEYRGAPFPGDAAGEGPARYHFENLLKDTIARATHEIMERRAGPECLSVFKDNAGVIAFDDVFGIAFKVETHNHPSAIEPYGGAATGIGGCIRDVIGCGLGAKPIASTDVFCVAPPTWPEERLPKGVLHPRRVLRGVVQGVADYGNRMGIPTVNGAVYFDPRYLANPLVYCGSVGLIPRNRVEKAPRPGDQIVVIGGRTGRDGIHGATFSSAEMTDTHADEFAHAVQIGNAIEEKRCLDAVLRARDAAGGPLYTAITDCGAGGLSSAVGEMASEIGGIVDLERVPLKYAGLRYDEIWISEAQERMVLAVPPASLEAFMQIMRAEQVEATAIGVFGDGATPPRPSKQLTIRYEGQIVGALDLHFLHDGLPRFTRNAAWTAPARARRATPPISPRAALAELPRQLARPEVAAKRWIVQRYDHEVQGGSVIKPFMGPGRGPSDAAVVRPRLDSERGIAIGCGLQPQLSDIDPYWMAAAGIDEAVRNVVCVGGDPRRTAILDNFCWGGCDDPEQMGALVRACQACYDVATAFHTPFISGKDSLNNQFALDADDVEPLIETMQRLAEANGDALDPAICERIRKTGRLAIPATLLISSIALLDDVRQAQSSDLKRSGATVLKIGGLDPLGFDFALAARTHALVASLIADRAVTACHDISESGWLPALVEMALGGRKGVHINAPSGDADSAFENRAAGYLVETRDAVDVQRRCAAAGVAGLALATVVAESRLTWDDAHLDLNACRTAWESLER